MIRTPQARDQVESLLSALEQGEARAAHPGEDPEGPWEVEAWVRRGILAAFRLGQLETMANLGGQSAFDKDLLPLQQFRLEDRVRIVPGGTAVRRGCHVAGGVTLMPPTYVNVGAHVETGTMIDSHALVGSCAQIGRHVHLSAGAQVGGVLEPVGASPVIVEDGVFVGALSGLFEGVHVRRGALIGTGVILTRSTPIVDLVRAPSDLREGDLIAFCQAGAYGETEAMPDFLLHPRAKVGFLEELSPPDCDIMRRPLEEQLQGQASVGPDLESSRGKDDSHQDQAGQNSADQNSADQNSASQNSADQNSAGQNSADQNSTGQNSAGQNSTGQNSTGQAVPIDGNGYHQNSPIARPPI